MTQTQLPIFGIFGHSGSGKTTLIEKLLARCRENGLDAAVAKFHAHGIDIDREGKDSDRFFRTGADVYLQGPEQGFLRTHPADDARNRSTLAEFARRHDVVLLEGRKQIACEKIWLLGDDESAPPDHVPDVLAVLNREADRGEIAWGILQNWLRRRWCEVPIFGCVLIGGKSQRMGKPKHLLTKSGTTWLEHTHACLGEVCERVVVVGAGALPEGLTQAMCLPDVTDADGPASGLLAAMRWAPEVSWLVAACDLPDLSTEALRWLLATRAPGVWATLPRLRGRENVEPLLAHYDFRARALFDDLLAGGRSAPSRLAGHPKVISPEPPEAVAAAWENVNTAKDLRRLGLDGTA